MWTDTVTPERLQAFFSLPLMGHVATTTHTRRRIILGPGLATRAATGESIGGRRELPGRRWLRLQRLGRIRLHVATVSSWRAG